jgi:hypothetical protein
MLCMIFALTIIATATLTLTTFAMSLMRWMLGLGRPLGHRQTPADVSFADEAQASRAIS